jgi:predicted Zn finger-like uncharacterized protein
MAAGRLLRRTPLRGGARRGTFPAPARHALCRQGPEGWAGMLIECPRCTARYEVADGLIGAAGKSVRCAKCGNVWLARRLAEAEDDAPLQWPESPRRPGRDEAMADAPAEAAEDPALAEFRAAQDEAAKPGFARFPGTPADAAVAGEAVARKRVASAALIGWVATVLVLGAAAWGSYAYRDAVIAAWPPSERVYLALGLGP